MVKNLKVRQAFTAIFLVSSFTGPVSPAWGMAERLPTTEDGNTSTSTQNETVIPREGETSPTPSPSPSNSLLGTLASSDNFVQGTADVLDSPGVTLEVTPQGTELRPPTPAPASGSTAMDVNIASPAAVADTERDGDVSDDDE